MVEWPWSQKKYKERQETEATKQQSLWAEQTSERLSVEQKSLWRSRKFTAEARSTKKQPSQEQEW